MEKEFVLSLIKEHFELECSLEELDEDLDFLQVTSKRIRLEKSLQCYNKALSNTIKYFLAKKTGEEYKCTSNISSVIARTFIIYESENKENTFKYIKRTYPKRIDFFEFETINNKYSIAYD